MEDVTTYKGIRIDDTAEWRLVVYMSTTGMSAYLKNIENPLEPEAVLFEERWEQDMSALLRRIETEVYDHPQLLDDFSTEIVVCTPRCIWVPESMAGDYESQSELFNKIYSAEEEDILCDTLHGMCCLYSPVAGLPAFLRRTLSGARVSSHLTVLARRFMNRGGDLPRIYVDIRENEVDFVVLDDKRLLLASTLQWHDPMDIAYHIFNIMDVYGLDSKNTQVSLSGMRDVKQILVKTLREKIAYVMLTMMPSAVSKTEMPIAAAIALTGTRE